MLRVILQILVLANLVGFPLTAVAQPFDVWLRNEFKLFRVYPRLDRAERFYSKEQYDATREIVSEALRIDPYSPQGLRLMVETCRRQNDFQCAYNFSTRMINLPDLRAAGAYYLTLDASRRGDIIDLIYWGNAALSESRGSINAEERRLLIELLESAYEHEEAESLLDDYSGELLAERITEELAGQEPEQMELSVQELLDSDTDMATLQIDEQLHAIYYLQSEREYQLALNLALVLPERSMSYFLIAELLEQLGRFGEAASMLLDSAPETHKRNPEFWQHIYFLYDQAGQRQEQINLLVQARPYILGSTALLEMASMLFLEEVNSNISNTGTEADLEDYDYQLAEIQQLLELININQAVVTTDLYRPFRLDSEIMLAGNLHARGYDQQAWELVQRLLADESISFNQVAALTPIVWSTDRCPEVINLFESSISSAAQQLLLVSCYRRMGNPARAFAQSEMLLEDLTLPADVALELRRNMGYLALQMEHKESALAIWEALLEEEESAQIALSAAYVALMLEDPGKAEALLGRIDEEQLSPAGHTQYWQTQARLAAMRGDQAGAIDSYQQALMWDDGNLDNWQQFAQLAEESGQLEMARQGWDKILQLQPDNINSNGAYAYFLNRQEMDGVAQQFQRASALDPGNTNLRRDLAFALLGTGEREEAATVLRGVIAENLENNNLRLYEDKELLGNIENKWIFEVNDVLRMNESPGAILNPGLRNSSYRGYGSLSATYQPDFGVDKRSEQRLLLTSRVYWGNPDQSARIEDENAVLAIGARYKLSERYAIFASAEKLFGIGSQARDDTLFRFSGSFFRGLGWPFDDTAWTYQNIYLDAAYFTRSEVEYATVEWERGRAYRLGGNQSDLALMPYFRLGAAANNDNAESIHETRLDAGLGLSLLFRGFNNSYTGHKLNSRISIVFSRKIAGNTRDKKATQLRFGFRF